MTRRKVGSIRQRKDGTWEARLTVNGKRRSYFGRTEAIATAKLEAAQRDLDVGLVLAGPRLTVAAWLRDWLTASKHRVRPSTLRRYHGLVENNIIPAIGHVPLAQLTPAAVERMLNDATEAGLSERSAHHMRAVLRTALTRAEKHGLVRRNSAALADPPRIPYAERHVLTPDDIGRLLEATRDDRFGPLYATAATTGLRLGELTRLRWADVDLDAGTLTVRGETKTPRSRRTIPLVLPGVLLAHRLASLSTKGLVFTRDGERPLYGSLVHREWGRWRGDFGGATFHDLRHAAASLWLASGADLKTIQAMLGHSKVEMTGHYTHVLPDGMREAALRVRQVMGVSEPMKAGRAL